MEKFIKRKKIYIKGICGGRKSLGSSVFYSHVVYLDLHVLINKPYALFKTIVRAAQILVPLYDYMVVVRLNGT